MGLSLGLGRAGYIDDQVSADLRGRIDGVLSSSDYPGATVAGAIATRLGLPGTDPVTLIACAHKYAARQALRAVVPDATPDFALLDGAATSDGSCAIGFPCFVKPVKGAFSVLSARGYPRTGTARATHSRCDGRGAVARTAPARVPPAV